MNKFLNKEILQTNNLQPNPPPVYLFIYLYFFWYHRILFLILCDYNPFVETMFSAAVVAAAAAVGLFAAKSGFK